MTGLPRLQFPPGARHCKQMGFDWTSWAFGWVLGKAGDHIFRKLDPESLEQQLERAYAEWARRHFVANEADAATLSNRAEELLDGSETAKREALRRALRAGELPGKDAWLSALLERWREVRANAPSADLRPFFRLDEDEARSHLAELAGELCRIVSQRLEFLGPAILTSLATVQARLESIEQRPLGLLLSGAFDAPSHKNPATLLNARYRVVPFFEAIRETEITLLEDWRASDESTSVRLFTGPGGSGKTRLFIEWIERLRSRGSAAGFLETDASDADVNTVATTQDAVVVVIDYAETRHEQLVRLLRAVARRSSGPRLRIALLAREVGDWWLALQKADTGIKCLLAASEPHRLRAVSVDFDQRGEVVRHAITAFAVELGKPEPSVDGVSFKDARFECPLYLHLAALAAVEERPLAAERLLEDTVDHEVRFWAKPRSLTRKFERQVSRLVTALTLRGRTARSELVGLDERVKGPCDEEFQDLVANLYPLSAKEGEGDAHLVGGLEPDLLGEAIVKATLTEPTTSDDYLEQVFQEVEVPLVAPGRRERVPAARVTHALMRGFGMIGVGRRPFARSQQDLMGRTTISLTSTSSGCSTA